MKKSILHSPGLRENIIDKETKKEIIIIIMAQIQIEADPNQTIIILIIITEMANTKNEF
jgi:formaldehyde-activating enzyme involved in methanogenesis